MDFTIIIPINNEERYLLYSLPSVYALKPSEVILIFDRCSDHSLVLSKRIAKEIGGESVTKFVEVNNSSPDWASRIAFLRNYGNDLSTNEIILTTDADIVLDEKIRDQINLIGNDDIAFISLSFYDYPYTIQSFTRRLFSTYTPAKSYAGLYIFSKKAWKETIDTESVKKLKRSEDTHLRLSIQKKYKATFKNSNSFHLRPTENKERHYLKGIDYWEVVHESFTKMLLHSILNLRPATMAGYLHARYIKKS
ncbi:glycosyltransferase family 2 protein [Candidatus Bathyarchaeota archaeon]|nr:glycosyltransferase family 2 protein [Candidatus Bathyarchaeota archaeon]